VAPAHHVPLSTSLHPFSSEQGKMTKPHTEPLGPPKAVSSTTLQSVVLYGLYLGCARKGQSFYPWGALSIIPVVRGEGRGMRMCLACAGRRSVRRVNGRIGGLPKRASASRRDSRVSSPQEWMDTPRTRQGIKRDSYRPHLGLDDGIRTGFGCQRARWLARTCRRTTCRGLSLPGAFYSQPRAPGTSLAARPTPRPSPTRPGAAPPSQSAAAGLRPARASGGRAPSCAKNKRVRVWGLAKQL